MVRLEKERLSIIRRVVRPGSVSTSVFQSLFTFLPFCAPTHWVTGPTKSLVLSFVLEV